MIDFKICRQCSNCAELDAGDVVEGKIPPRLRPTVVCALNDDTKVLFVDSEPPEGCPYAMEHKMGMQKAVAEAI